MDRRPRNDTGESSGGSRTSSIVSARRLTKNVGWNLVGTILPLIGLLIATPLIVESLDLRALGLISVGWASIGYFALLDLGLGRTIAHFASKKIGGGRSDGLRPLILTTYAALLMLGVGFALILFAFSGRIAGAIATDPVQETADVGTAIRILSAAVPFVVIGTGFRGLLQAYQRFDIINIVRVPVATATYLAPALVALATGSLPGTMITLVIVRIVGSIVLAVSTRGLVDPGDGYRFLSIQESIAVLKYGGWLTVSSVISPVLVYLDKILVIALVSLTAVAYYSTSFDIASKLLILPASVAAVAFPALSLTMSGRTGTARSARIYRGTAFLSLAMLLAGGTVLSAVASEGLTIWLGTDFAQNATTVFVLLVAASVVNGVAQAPFGLIQAGGRPDITAKLHLVEAPVYIVLAFVLVSSYGITGAAVALGLRITFDAFALVWISKRFLSDDGARRRAMLVLLMLAPVAVIVSALPPALLVRLAVAVVAAATAVAIGWRTFLLPGDRTQLRELARSSLPRRAVPKAGSDVSEGTEGSNR